MTATIDAPPAAPPQGSTPAWPAALAGAVAAAVALAAAELLAGLAGPVPSLVTAVGNAVVEAGSGTPVKDIAIALFGTAEKTALIVGTALLSLVLGAGLGVLGRRRGMWLPALGFAAFGLLGIAATTVNPLDSTAWSVPAAVVAAGSGIAVLRWLLAYDARLVTAAGSGAAPEKVARGRRDLLRIALALGAVAGVTGALGRSLVGRGQTNAAREAVVLPDAAASTIRVPEGTAFEGIDGLSPLFTPNDDFYRIDTALMPPVVDVTTWQVRIHGMVDREVVLTYEDLLSMEQLEQPVTIACVSNEVGDDLIGTAMWQGVRLADVLDMAGVDPAVATQLVGRSVDGWTAGFPTDIAFDGRDAMIAVAMNGEPLPVDHGFPARLIVPGLYGYVSATKWLSEIELTTWEAFDGYWVPRGWSKEGPIKTQSRIDAPPRGAALTAGEVWVAGVAWAQRRGITRVEVQVDDGDWQDAELAEELDVDVWRQWRWRWDATPGEHAIRVRATDADGVTQSEERVPVAPDGAEGYHTRSFRVA